MKEIKLRHTGYVKTLKDLKINGCAICGYNKCNRSLHFHHVNPKDRIFGITYSGLGYSNERIAEEISKCILLCCNCHGEIHDKNKESYIKNS